MHVQHNGTAPNRQDMRLTTHHGLLVAWGQVAHWLGSPVVADKAVGKAWGLSSFAHFSTVCRTLRAFTEENVSELEDAVDAIMTPLLRGRAVAVGQTFHLEIPDFCKSRM